MPDYSMKLESLKTIPTTHVLAISLAYMLCHLPMLFLGDQVSWDDWIIYRETPQNLAVLAQKIGAPWLTEYFELMSYSRPEIVRLAQFLIFLWCSIFIYGTSSNIGSGKQHAFMVAIVFAVAPLNSSRFLLITFFYSISTLFFFLFFYRASIRLSKITGLGHLVNTFILIIAFQTKSYLVLFYAYFAYVVFIGYSSTENSKGREFLLKYKYYLFLPILYYILLQVFSLPAKEYADYYEVKISPTLWLQRFLDSLVGLLRAVYQRDPQAVVVTLIVCISLIVFTLHSLSSVISVNLHRRKLMQPMTAGQPAVRPCVGPVVGIALIAAGLFPYLAIGVIPEFGHYSSRHQLGLMLGFSVLTAGLLSSAISPLRRYIIVIIVLSSILSWWTHYFDAHVMYSKQRSIIAQIRSLEPLQFTDVIVHDDTEHLNLWETPFNTNEWHGMFAAATGLRNLCIKRFGPSAWEDDNYILRNQPEIFADCDGSVYAKMDQYKPRGNLGRIYITSEHERESYRPKLQAFLIDLLTSSRVPLSLELRKRVIIADAPMDRPH
ncbi:hypothetical protein [Pollutimonas thiosulfatoxidans]|uniref:Glycosyltransferase RgtA/B/C/D-like domain-containing protein n=1 Tax=Pollutimonas thiosulfatoxidans TaxID=2028345 RepID=A0A410GEH6_9BURK|nr:hypothetical protein [Pollutimonas thiosulfatoxidans]QAA94700.1 hypothetical protein CKA81_13260 [Pollutimonas thiosulfatoxidans]